MRKLFFLLLVITASLNAVAQDSSKDELEVIDMNRTFSVGGKAIMCLRSNKAERRNVKPLEWTLKNDRIGETNIVVLDVKNTNTNEIVAHQSWSEGVMVRMKRKEKKPVMYEVYDDMFSHLRMADTGFGWVILFYSEMIDK